MSEPWKRRCFQLVLGNMSKVTPKEDPQTWWRVSTLERKESRVGGPEPHVSDFRLHIWVLTTSRNLGKLLKYLSLSTLLNKIMVILIKVHLNYFKTCCGKDSSETTERKNFYLYSNCITFFSTYQHKTVIFIILINMKK